MLVLVLEGANVVTCCCWCWKELVLLLVGAIGVIVARGSAKNV